MLHSKVFDSERPMTLPTRLIPLLTLLACVSLASLAQAQTPADPVVMRFSTVGDSRQDPKEADPSMLPLSVQDTIWLQNTKAWSRIMRGVESQQSKLLFFNGDMVMGYGLAGPTRSNSVADVVGSDLMAFYRQYGFWRGMVAPLMESGTYVVPVPGNHEVQSKPMGKKAQPENEAAWRANMGDLIIDTARFQRIVGQPAGHVDVQNNGPIDGLASDQSQLSYSFDVADAHFTVINTDPVGRDSSAPVRWLAKDLEEARARGAKHVFVFGHKPAYTYHYAAHDKGDGAPAGLDVSLPARDALWDVIERMGATYFCGHEHEFNLSQPRGAAWQVLVGSGGSPWDALPGEATRNPQGDRSYVWATVEIRQSGKVTIDAWGFDEHYGPTVQLGHIELAH